MCRGFNSHSAHFCFPAEISNFPAVFFRFPIFQVDCAALSGHAALTIGIGLPNAVATAAGQGTARVHLWGYTPGVRFD